MKDKYIFPAIFESAEKEGYVVTFPDLPSCITEGKNLKEALELHIYGLEEDGEKIPEATPPEKLNVPKGAFIVLIIAYMPPVREMMAKKSVN